MRWKSDCSKQLRSIFQAYLHIFLTSFDQGTLQPDLKNDNVSSHLIREKSGIKLQLQSSYENLRTLHGMTTIRNISTFYKCFKGLVKVPHEKLLFKIHHYCKRVQFLSGYETSWRIDSNRVIFEEATSQKGETAKKGITIHKILNWNQQIRNNTNKVNKLENYVIEIFEAGLAKLNRFAIKHLY